jgi:hypothetical protein
MARRPPQVASGAQAVLAVKRHSATGTGPGDETPPPPAHNTDTLRGITSTRVGRNREATAPTGTPTKKVEDTRTGTKKRAHRLDREARVASDEAKVRQWRVTGYPRPRYPTSG